MKKSLALFTLLAASVSGFAHADDAAIKQSLTKLGVASSGNPASAGGWHENGADQQRRAVRDRRR
ncbi:hypothetical protein ACVXG7_25955 [Enterobacter hormaechei]